MALALGTIFEMRASALSGNLNAAGFNPANANMLTDLATDTNTANTASPIVSSASYNFAAGDVGSYVYVKTGTSWQSGWYAIASVAANKATLSAAIGSVVIAINTQGVVTRNTVVGCTSNNTATLTGGTFTVDYSQQDAAKISAIADFTAVGSSATLTSATAGFTPVMVGNFFHQTTTGVGAFGLTGWYEIVSYTNATTVVLDRTSNNGTASVGCTGYVGGAARLNGLDDAFYEMLPAGFLVYFKSGSSTISANISVSSTNATVQNPGFTIGYTTVRGDVCNGANRPTIIGGGSGTIFGVNQYFVNIQVSSGAAAGLSLGAGALAINCSGKNLSAATGRAGITTGGSKGGTILSEAVSQNGIGISCGVANPYVAGCYIHDSVNGSICTTTNPVYYRSIFENCSTSAITFSSATANTVIDSCTIYGTEAKLGIGILNSSLGQNTRITNCILYGLSTGISVTTTQQDSGMEFTNNYFNNTADVANFLKSSSALAINPQFAGATQLTGATATTSGSVLTQSGGDFSSVTDNIDYLYLISGTGTTNSSYYLITSHTATTVTLNNPPGTNATADKVWSIGVGHNFNVTNPALQTGGFPSFTNSGSDSTNYLTVGAVQAQGSGGQRSYVGGG